jgi:hypothetical protein
MLQLVVCKASSSRDFVEGLAVLLQGIAGMARAVPRLLQHLHLQVRAYVLHETVSVKTGRSWSCAEAVLQAVQQAARGGHHHGDNQNMMQLAASCV